MKKYEKKLLTEVKELLREGKQQEARKLLIDAPFVESRDYQFHKEISKIFGILGMRGLQIKELELSIRDNPQDVESYDRLSDIYLELADYKKTEKTLKKAIKNIPKESLFYIKLGEIYKKQEKYGLLRTLYQQAYERTENTFFKKHTFKVEEPRLLEPEHIHLVKYAMLFRGREGIYPRQWVDSTGGIGYSPVKAPLTFNVIKNHILGTYTVGIYQLKADSTVNFIAFDIDVSKRFLKEYITQQPIKESLDSQMFQYAKRIVYTLKELDIKSYIEFSGLKGYHVWVFLEHPIPASKARLFGKYIIDRTGKIPETMSIELFPKQDHLKSEESLGNLIKLPLGIHRKSGNRAVFVDSETGEKIGDQLGFLLEMDRTDERKILNTIKNLTQKITIPSVEEEEKEHKEEEFSVEEDREFNLIIRRCPVIGTLYENIKNGNGLKGNEVGILVFTLGHLKNGPKIVNSLLQMANVFEKRLYLKSRLKGYPISCGKIRKKIPYITMNVCKDCFAGEDIQSYPNPLLHLREFEKEEKDIETMILEYVELSKKHDEISRLLQRAKETILSFMVERGIRSLKINQFLVETEENGNDLHIKTGNNTEQAQ